jgi:hypothetical protein
VGPAEHDRERDREQGDVPGPETRAVARGEVRPHVYLLVATALMPQNVPQ